MQDYFDNLNINYQKKLTFEKIFKNHLVLSFSK